MTGWLAAARFRESLLTEAGDVPGWIAIHRPVGSDGCTCRLGWKCDRKAKHPVAVRFPHGSRDVSRLDEVLDWLDSPAGAVGRLAAVIAPEIQERVLDVDSARGLACLWRAGEELEAGWLHVRTPRGLHVHQLGVMPKGYGDIPRRNRVRATVGLDVKYSGYVCWPDDVERWSVEPGVAVDWLARRFPGVEMGSFVIAGPTERERLRFGSPEREALALVASAVQWSDPVDLHVDALRWLRETPPGDRNNSLNLAAWRCRGLVAYHGWNEAEVAESLYKAGREVGLEHGETERTVRSGLGIGRDGWRKL